MAYFYCDAATGSDGNGGTSWADAKASLESTLTAATGAGDIIYIRANASETTKDTSASNRTFTTAGTLTNPLKIIGVVAGTTNTGSSVVAADLAVKTGDQPVIETTGAATMDFQDSFSISYVKIDCAGNIYTGDDTHIQEYNECDIDCTAVNPWYGQYLVRMNGCEVDIGTTSYMIFSNSGAGGNFEINGGEWTCSAGNPFTILDVTPKTHADFRGVYFNIATWNGLVNGGKNGSARLINCRMAASTYPIWSDSTSPQGWVEMINSDNSSAVGNTSSVQNYFYHDCYGEINEETTAVRTNGADDNAAGGFSYAMQTHASSTLEGSMANLASPWLCQWTDNGGTSTTFTVHIANSSASTDYNEDEVWCEFYTMDAGDTAQHDQTFDPAASRLLENTTAVTDDTGSTWGTGANNHQKFEITVTPGFRGVVWARVHLAKRQGTPDTLYLDPKIVIS